MNSKLVNLDLVLRKWIHLVYMFISILQRLHQRCNVSSIHCKSSGDLPTCIKAISSAYYSIDNLISSTPKFRMFISYTKSFIKIENRVGDKLSPCLIPVLQLNQFVSFPLIRTQDSALC